MPRVFTREHRGELMVAWFWPGGQMWLQPRGGVPVEVTSEEFATSVELDWTPLDVAPGAAAVLFETPTGPAYFELVR